MILSNRLKSIASFVSKDSTVSDIGCDHALLGAYLLEKNIVKKVIAVDILEKPINLAKEKYKNIDFRLGDGLNPVSLHELDTVIISGLGGKTIKKIISNKKIKKARKAIISPNIDSFLVRKKMMENGFHISDEKLVKCKSKIYEIIVFKKGRKIYSYKDLWIGPIILKNKSELFYEKHTKVLRKYTSFKAAMPLSIKKLMIARKIRILKNEKVFSK